MSAAVWTPLETPPPPAAARTPAAPPPPAAQGWRAVTPGAWLVWGRAWPVTLQRRGFAGASDTSRSE